MTILIVTAEAICFCCDITDGIKQKIDVGVTLTEKSCECHDRDCQPPDNPQSIPEDDSV